MNIGKYKKNTERIFHITEDEFPTLRQYLNANEMTITSCQNCPIASCVSDRWIVFANKKNRKVVYEP